MQVLPSPVLVPTSMSEGGEIHDNSAAMAGPGSTPVIAMPATIIPPETLPLPEMPPQAPVNPQAGKYGAVGLQHAGARAPEGGAEGGQWPGGVQGGGLQGAGNPGAGDSGNGDLWKATPSFGPPRWGPQASNS